MITTIQSGRQPLELRNKSRFKRLQEKMMASIEAISVHFTKLFSMLQGSQLAKDGKQAKEINLKIIIMKMHKAKKKEKEI